jgi:hypothetical protein
MNKKKTILKRIKEVFDEYIRDLKNFKNLPKERKKTVVFATLAIAVIILQNYLGLKMIFFSGY